MRVRDDSLLRITLALRKPDSSVAAIKALHGNADTIAVEGLFELIVAAPSSRSVVAALNALADIGHPLIPSVMQSGMRSASAPARLAAVQITHQRKFAGLGDEVVWVLREDESWRNRRAALLALAET